MERGYSRDVSALIATLKKAGDQVADKLHIIPVKSSFQFLMSKEKEKKNPAIKLIPQNIPLAYQDQE